MIISCFICDEIRIEIRQNVFEDKLQLRKNTTTNLIGFSKNPVLLEIVA